MLIFAYYIIVLPTTYLNLKRYIYIFIYLFMNNLALLCYIIHHANSVKPEMLFKKGMNCIIRF